MGNWSQASFRYAEEDDGDIAFENEPTNHDDRARLTRFQSSDSILPIHDMLPTNRNKRLYDSPLPPDLEFEAALGQAGVHNDSLTYPPDLEGFPNTYRKNKTRRKSARAKGTSTHYRRSAGIEGSSDVSRQKSILDTAKRELKRMSIRVVNLKQRDETRHVRLQDDQDSEDQDDIDPESPHDQSSAAIGTKTAEGAGQDIVSPENTKVALDDGDGVLKGRTLGVFGSHSRLRRAALAVFVWPYACSFFLIPCFLLTL